MTEDDPSVIRSIAVSPQDAVDAYAYSQENPGNAVLRLTPPFHGRMRARLHVYHIDDGELTGAVHVSPAAVIKDDIVEEYPLPKKTIGDAAHDEPSETAQVHERRAEAVTAWQARAREALVDEVAIELDDGPHRVELKQVG